MRKYCIVSLLLSSIVIPSEAQTNHSPSTIETVKPEKKPDNLVEQQIIELFDLKHKFRDEPTRYDYNRVDLNGDGEPEILVHVFGKNMCAAGGCTTLVLRKKENRYIVLTQIDLTRVPVFVSQHVTNGWKDLILLVNGGNTLPGYYAVLPFNGRAYPSGASTSSAEPLDSSQPATAYIPSISMRSISRTSRTL